MIATGHDAGRSGQALDPPGPVSFQTAVYEGGTVFPRQKRPWAELHYALSGLCEFDIGGRRYLSPAQYGIWIPPDVEHESWNRIRMRYVSVFIHVDRCAGLPRTPCTLAVSPLIKAVLADFASRGVTLPAAVEDLRLADVLLDQIRLANRFDDYLPFSDDELLGAVLREQQLHPDDRRSVAQLAQAHGTTERTLARRSRDKLGMSIGDWRQRMKLIQALALLDEGVSVQRVAAALGYANASAFIAMFRRLTGASPARMRKA